MFTICISSIFPVTILWLAPSEMVTNQNHILALTVGLPSSYDAIIINSNPTPADQLTLNNIIVCLC